MPRHHTPTRATRQRHLDQDRTRRHRRFGALMRQSGRDNRREQRVLAAYHADNARRARARTVEVVQTGHHIGPIPYGYQPRQAAAEPGSNRGSRGSMVLVMQPVEAATVATIFTWRVQDGLRSAQIARRLAEARYPAPLHLVTREPVPWNARQVQRILANPVYTGRSVWGRRHADRAVSPQLWVMSPRREYLAIVTDDHFVAAQPDHNYRTAVAMRFDSSRLGTSTGPADGRDTGGRV